MTTTTTDLKEEIGVVVSFLKEAEKELVFLQSVYDSLESGSAEFGPEALNKAKRAFTGSLTRANTKLAVIIAEAKNI